LGGVGGPPPPPPPRSLLPPRAAPSTSLSIFEFMAVIQLSGLVSPVTGLIEADIRVAFLHARMTVVCVGCWVLGAGCGVVCVGCGVVCFGC
jgi:hypothetical protein